MSYDMIRRDALLEFARNHIDGKIDCNDIARFPYANAKPVRRGRWEDCYPNDRIISDTVYACSVCGAAVFKNFAPKMNFCPNCGAKMDAEVE
jgi:rubrerythrin